LPWEEAASENFYDTVYHRRYGGDLQGVIDKLDYLKELGINTIYFNPVFYARSLHKYDGNSFHHIDPYFGPDPEGDLAIIAQETSDPATWQWTAADRLFLRLVDEAHRRGLRVLIDGVWNHTGRDFFAFLDLYENQEASTYKDWYIVNRFDDPATEANEFDYEGWWGVESLPIFADTEDGEDLHPGPKQYVFDATARWMDPDGDGDPADGIDGWRLDVANEVPLGFWADWNAHVRALNPAAYTVTEIWHDAAAFLQEGGFSATMNYHGFAFPVKAFLIDRAVPPSRFGAMLDERRAQYPEAMQFVLQNLIDSHDTDRLASMILNRDPADGAQEQFGYDRAVTPMHGQSPDYRVHAPGETDRHLQRLVALFQMTYLGAPMIYYGTEAGMWGADDPDDRKPMVWPDLTYADEAIDPMGRERPADPVAFDSSLYRFYRDVIALRNDHAALRHGAFDVLAADDEHDVFAFARTLGADALVVVLNRSEAAHSLRLPKPAPGTYEPVFLSRDDAHRVQQDAEGLILELPPLAGMVLRRTDAPNP
ncbi:MAG: alpha-amylase family glycosyl hydrolase, partial [Rhodothermales bacterium]|nr:alpha-amylase family glycosyl hydrolase [Rhodothermales bacterium]